LTQSQVDPPVTADRVQRRSTRKRRFPAALLAVPIVLVAAGVAAILLLGGGDGPLGVIGGGDDADEVPPFDFRVGKTGVVATAPEADVGALKTEAGAIVPDVVTVLDELYTNGFLDPANWRENDYEEVVDLFSAEAAPAAEQSLDALTLGAAAGDVYETVTPSRGGLKFSVLFDPDGNPDTVAVTVRFTALGARQDGTYTAIVSEGELFLRDIDGWKITGFDLRRKDHETEPPPSPSASGSASGPASETG
jgi:hypothetical protein